jgi:cyclopropane fatty-acyl-phospholipid synthase-like methyltransferase
MIFHKSTLMIATYYEIKDSCRKGLLRYLEKAFSMIPVTDNPKILDIGCGTGVPALWIADNYPGIITAIDPDKDALAWLISKINDRDMSDRVTALNISFYDFKANPDHYDIIIAEGFLNVVGFESAFPGVIEILRKNGYFIIHDEFKDNEKKCDFIRSNDCKIVDTLFLDEKVWWNDYYRQLESEIKAIESETLRELFSSDLEEIKYYRINPGSFKSVYYIVEKL